MRAVNLIPDEQRRSAVRGPGRSQGAAYAVLVLLGGLAILAGLYGSARRKIASNQAQVSALAVQAQQAQVTASRLAPYTNFVSMRNQRVEAVNTLVASRFDWAHAFHEVGRVLPAGVWLTNVAGTLGGPSASSAAPASGASGASGSSGVASTTPPGSVVAFSLSGCAASQAQVALTLDRLRLIDGVSEVTLQSSTKAAGTSASTCSGGDPSFDATVTFEPLPTPSSSSASATSPAASSATGAG
jgi:Tfp pilus assembly protein PilN